MIENKDRPHIKSGSIKYTKGFRSRMIFSKAINALIITMIFIIVSISIFVFMKQPVKTSNGYVLANPIYEFAEHGEKIIVVNDEKFNMFTPIKRFMFEQDVYFAKVIAGPYGKVEQTKGKQRVNDGQTIVNVNLSNSDKEYLDLEYVVRKLDSEGNELQKEKDLIITKDKILGSKKQEIE